MEIVVSLVIIGVLSALAILNYGPVKEKSLNRQAQANLRLIMAAEKIYKMRMNSYYPYGGGTDSSLNNINSYLKLPVSDPNWNYQVSSTTVPASSCVQAARNDPSNPANNQIWSFRDTQAAAVSGPCP